MYFVHVLASSFFMVLLALLATVVFYVCLVFLLRRKNKYNVRNAGFIILSIFFIPTMFVELSIVFSVFHLKRTVVPEAKEYACNVANSVDNLSETVKGCLDGVVILASNKAGEQVKGAVEGVSDLVSDSLSEKVHPLAGNVVEEFGNGVGNAASEAIVGVGSGLSSAVGEVVEDVLPANPIAAAKARFPLLARFLDENELHGNNANEIVNSAFIKLDRLLTFFIFNRLKNLGIFLLFLLAVSLLWGWRKKEKNEPQMMVTQQK